MNQELPIPNNEEARIKSLLSYKILDTEAEKRFDNLTKLAAQICEVPVCLITFIDGDRQWFKSKVGTDLSERPRELTFCQYAIMSHALLLVEDATEDNRFKDFEVVNEEPNIRFYAGQPIMDDNGNALGTLCVFDVKPRQLSEVQKNAMNILSQEVTALISCRKKDHERMVYYKFFELSNQAMGVFHNEGHFSHVNEAFLKLTGWSESELTLQGMDAFVHPEDINLVKSHLSLSQSRHQFKFRLKLKSREYINISWESTKDDEKHDLYVTLNLID